MKYRNAPASGNAEILSKINFDANGNILLRTSDGSFRTLKHAAIEYQREVSDYIFDNLSFSRIDSMREMYGQPVWELATIDISSTNISNYLITIPLVNDKKFTGILFYQNMNGQKNIHLFNHNKISKVLSVQPLNFEFVQKWIVPVGKFNTYNGLINSSSNLNLKNWLISAKSLLNTQTQLIYRDAEEICTTIYSELIVVGGQAYYECWDWCITYGSSSGGGSGSGTGDDFNGYFGDDDFGSNWNDGGDFGSSGGGGGSGNFGDGNNNVPKVDKAKKLKCAVEVADFMAQAEVLELIANNNFIDPCDPTKSAAELLEKALNGYCYAKSGDEPLNLKDAEHFIREIVEVGEGVKINIGSSLNSDCPDMVCLINNLKNGNLSSSYLCDILANFNPTDGIPRPGNFINIRGFDFSKDPNLKETANAITRTTLTGSIEILINTKNCGEKDDFYNFETLQHELVHAKIFSDLFTQYGYAGIQGSMNYYQAFEQLVIKEYGSNATVEQHKLMLDKYLKNMVESLIEVTGVGSYPLNYEDYVGLILQGFPNDILESCGYTADIVADKYHSYQVYLLNHQQILEKFQNLKCP